MKNENHLPLYGVGPIYGAIIIVLTVAGMLLTGCNLLPAGSDTALRLPVDVAAILLIAIGILLWVKAVVQARIDANILANKLVTTGVYAWVRNPIYAAFLFACTGALLLMHNLWLLLLPPLYWALMTVLMKHTEEKWLTERYGAEYQEYCQRTNRCIPRFPRKNGR